MQSDRRLWRGREETVKRRIYRGLLSLIGLCLLLAVSGCGFSFSPEELYSLPQLPAEYTELNNCINQVIESGAEYAAPVSGSNIQSVQLEDLNGDGEEEAVAFFRNTADEKPLKIYIFTAEEETYRQTAVIEGTGTSIYSIAYEDLDQDGWKELLVGWRVNTDLQALSVYTLRSGVPEELIRGTNYVRYAVNDLNQDDLWELVVFRADAEGNGMADYYCWEDGALQLRTSARITSTMAELSQQGRVKSGTLADNSPALFVTGVEESAWMATDILTVKNGELVNILLSDVTGVSSEVAPFCALYPEDINGDNITEVPRPVTEHGRNGEEDDGVWRIDWYAFAGDGTGTLVLQTYHNVEDGWYLRLQETWDGQVAAVRSTGTDESAVTFSYRENEADIPFLRITKLTGPSREIRATRGGRIILRRQMETIYTAELLEANETWRHGLSEDELLEAFNLITQEWTTSDS